MPARSSDSLSPKLVQVRVEIFNVLGQTMRVLVDDPLPTGEHSISWDGKLADGREASSGIFFYRIEAGGMSQVRKLVILK